MRRFTLAASNKRKCKREDKVEQIRLKSQIGHKGRTSKGLGEMLNIQCSIFNVQLPAEASKLLGKMLNNQCSSA